MENKKIIKLLPLEKSISFIIHINNICNFNCDYCALWKLSSKERLSRNDIRNIIKSINLLREKWDNRYIKIDINGWEPTLNNDLITIVKEFLYIDNLSIQISTNLFRLLHFEKELELLSTDNNIWKLRFYISYHYFEYKNKHKELQFIKSILFLVNNKVNFIIKFLLPDNKERLVDFLNIKNKISKDCNLSEDFFTYDLIIDTLWNISKSYSEEVLNYFNKQSNAKEKKQEVNKKNNKEKLGLKVIYDDKSNEVIDFSDIRTRWLNKFKWFNCFYISKEYMEIWISHEWYMRFWPCYTLNKLIYKVKDLKGILSSDKMILCSEDFCNCWINLKKGINLKYNKLEKIENIILFEMKKYLIDFDVIRVWINIKNNIIIYLKYNNYYISIFITKDIKTWFFVIENIIKNERNIILKVIEQKENKIKQLINDRYIIFNKFYNIFYMIL